MIFGEIPRNFHQNRWKNQRKLLENSDFSENSRKNAKKFYEILLRFSLSTGAKECQSCRSRKMLKYRLMKKACTAFLRKTDSLVLVGGFFMDHAERMRGAWRMGEELNTQLKTRTNWRPVAGSRGSSFAWSFRSKVSLTFGRRRPRQKLLAGNS